jgi:hypothetical protein
MTYKLPSTSAIRGRAMLAEPTTLFPSSQQQLTLVAICTSVAIAVICTR